MNRQSVVQSIIHEEQIFLRALEFEDSIEQHAYLAKSCGENVDLQQRLVRMLRLHGRQDNILDCPADELFRENEIDEVSISAGTEIGPYKLLQQIGVGGMGVIFMAMQTKPVRRTVAIKIIKRGIDSRNVTARFESERQALAIMEHPNITRFYDAGITQSGRPYFVMELITGLPITRYSDDRRLGPRQRMELFYKVCNAIQHAHQKGVIHRDIKPSNVMVTEIDGEAVPKVIDFGIAKAVNHQLTDKTLFTSYGNIIGTPEYMSPEQAEMNGLDVDTRSDVYSLGAVLYELMTGITPLIEYKSNGLLKFCDAICNVEPALASTHVNNLLDTRKEIATNRGGDVRTLKQFLKGDVDWILAKCLAKRREDRYATAAELAADVGRHLGGEPILAGAAGKTYRLKKFLARNRSVAASLTILLASMLVATGVSLMFAVRASDAEKIANEHLKLSQKSQQVAETERDRALAAEARIRDLERARRLEASNAQAIVRYLNREKADAGIASTATQDADNTVSESQPLRVEVAENGNISLTSADGDFTLEFAVRSREAPLANSTRSRIQELGPAGREQARQVLSLVTGELRKRFGQLDLFVAEPQLMLAELEMQNQNWQVAEQHVRHIAGLFVNNYSRRDLRAKNKLLLAVVIAKQDIASGEAIQLLRQNHEFLAGLPEIDAVLKDVLVEIGQALSKQQDPDGVKDMPLTQAIDKLLALEKVVLSEVFDSMELELQKRANGVRSR